MKLSYEHLNSPCAQCYLRGHTFSSDNKQCQQCEYFVTMETLKKVLQINDNCLCCLHKKYMGGGYYDCKANEDYGNMKCTKFEIDWEKVFMEYNL